MQTVKELDKKSEDVSLYIRKKPDIASYNEINYSTSKKHINSLLDSKIKDFIIVKEVSDKDYSNSVKFETEIIIHSKIVEVNSDYVILNCLIDQDKNIYQRRKFDIEPMRGTLDFYEGENVKIIIKTKSGERRYIYKKDDTNINFEFKERDVFSKYSGSSFFPKSDNK